MQTAMKKAIRLGRATMLAIGVGVSFALVLGLATVALAAVPGDPFKLGKVNVINNATTALRGGAPSGLPFVDIQRDSGTGAALEVENTVDSFASNRGIDITVPAGERPIQVNPDAGKATSLNADRLDGLSAGSFLTFEERDRFMPSDTYVNQVSERGPGSSGTQFANVDCDPGDKLLGGGGQAVNPNEDTVTASVPFVEGQGWDFQIRDNGSASFVDAFALCADFPPEH